MKGHPGVVVAGEPLNPSSVVNQRVVQFWDTDQYTGANPSADTARGLAEYTNANFASQNTILTELLPESAARRFPHPARAETNLAQLVSDGVIPQEVYAEDGIPDTVVYLKKQGPGVSLDNFAKAGFFRRPILALDQTVSRTLVPLALLTTRPHDSGKEQKASSHGLSEVNRSAPPSNSGRYFLDVPIVACD